MPLFPAHKLRLPRRGGSKLLDRALSAVSSAPCNRCGVMCSRDGSFSDSKQTPSVVRENLPEEPKDRCCSGFHREFAFSASFLLADLSALCDRLHHVVSSGCCYDASHLKWKESKTMTSLFAFLASIIEMIASAGAGVASIGFGYEPELPEELRK